MKVLLDLFVRVLAFASGIGVLLLGGVGLLGYLLPGTGSKPGIETFVPAVLCAVIFFGCTRYETARRKSILRRVKEQFGIDFSQGRLMGKWEDAFVIFDESSRKLLISAFGGHRVNVHPYNYIKSWRLTWVENSINGRLSQKDVKIELELNDLDRPHLAIPIQNMAVGKDWNSRLDLLLNSR